jgi:hypothetical protein
MQDPKNARKLGCVAVRKVGDWFVRGNRDFSLT